MTSSDIAALLKIKYEGPIQDLLENNTPFLNHIDRKTVETGGKHHYIPLRTGRTESIGARNDTSQTTLPTGGTPTYGSATFTVQSLYLTLRITGFSMRASRSNEFAFAEAKMRDIEDSVKDLYKDFSRQLFGSGNANLARVSTATTNTCTVTNVLYPTNPCKFISASGNLVADIRTFSNGRTVTSGVGISLTRIGTNTLSYTGGGFTATTNTQEITRLNNNTGGASADGVPLEIYGLCGAIDERNPNKVWTSTADTAANYGNIDRDTAANSNWQGQRLHNSGTNRSLSLNLWEYAIEVAELNAGANITLAITNYPIYRIYGVGLATTKNASMTEMTLDGGYKTLNINGLPLWKDPECPDYHTFFIDESTWELAHTGPWAWLDENGNMLTRLAAADNYEAVMARDCQLICRDPKKNVKVTDIAHS